MSVNPAKGLLKIAHRPLLVSGMLCGRDSGRQALIIVNSEQPQEEKVVAAWHEVVHLLQGEGVEIPDEEQVEAAAQKLAACCPEILDWMGLTERGRDEGEDEEESQEEDCKEESG